MANVLNRTSKAYLTSVNTPDYSEVDWIINPDLSSVISVPQKYWKIDGDSVLEMTTEEKAAIDANLEISKESNYAESILLSTTTSSDWQTKVTLTLNAVMNRTYIVEWSWEWFYTNTSRQFQGRVFLDNTTIVGSCIDTTNSKLTTNRKQTSGRALISLTQGTHTFTIDWKSSDKSDTAGIANARLMVKAG